MIRVLVLLLLWLNVFASDDTVDTSTYIINEVEEAQMYSWAADYTFIEAYATTTLKANAPYIKTKYEYIWNIITPSDLELQFYGKTITYEFIETGLYDITVIIVHKETGDLTATVTATGLCKYVRREVRSYGEYDRNSFFTAMEYMYRTPSIEGQQYYGSSFRDVYFYSAAHNELAGNGICDQMHDGLGFLTQHTGLSLMFERTLRSINPALTMPYWEYTIEAERYRHTKNLSYVADTSPIFKPEWFGQIHTTTEGGIVSHGRWAYTEVLEVVDTDNTDHTDWDLTVHNGHNLMRGAWNMNPHPYLTRYKNLAGYDIAANTLPICSDFYTMVMEYDSWDGFGLEIQYSPHGSVHTLGAGFYSPNLEAIMVAAGMEQYQIKWLASGGVIVQRFMYIDGYLACPDECKVDVDGGNTTETVFFDCDCYCPDLKEYLKPGNEFAFHNVINSYWDFENVTVNDTSIWHAALRLMCNDQTLKDDPLSYQGDLQGSNGPIDPLFWPMHPGIARLWEYKRTMGLENQTWTSGSSIYGANCTGHDKDSKVAWYDLFLGDPVQQTFNYTNAVLYEMLDPDSLPYSPIETVYDNYLWPHCEYEDLLDPDMVLGLVAAANETDAAINGTVLPLV